MYPPAGAGPSPIKITLILGSIAWIVAACRALAMTARYQGKVARLYFRVDAAFAMPEVYVFLEAEGIRYTIRLPVNRVLQDKNGHLLMSPVGSPPNEVRRFHASFSYLIDHPARETHQDRREGCEPWPLRHLPDGGGRGAEEIVRRYPGADRQVAGAARASMSCGRKGTGQAPSSDLLVGEAELEHHPSESPVIRGMSVKYVVPLACNRS
jgi:hypothetical protein